VLFLVAIFNMFVYVFRSLNRKRPEGEPFLAWFYGLVICFNLFFIVAVSYVSLFNGGERFEYQRIGIIIYGSIGLMIAWAFAWPVYLIFSKKKSAINN
jgi:O-antigen/teichoic acid export membrane protein